LGESASQGRRRPSLATLEDVSPPLRRLAFADSHRLNVYGRLIEFLAVKRLWLCRLVAIVELKVAAVFEELDRVFKDDTTD